jgi:hypothetical protein
MLPLCIRVVQADARDTSPVDASQSGNQRRIFSRSEKNICAVTAALNRGRVVQLGSAANSEVSNQ